MPVLDTVTTDTVMSNTAAETTLYTFTVPANRGAIPGAVLELDMMLTMLNNSGANRTYVPRIKFGGATLISDALPVIPPSASLRAMHIKVRIQNDGSLTAHSMECTISVSAVRAVTAAGLAGDFESADIMPPRTIYATGTANQGTNLTLAVTLQADAATATQTITMRSAILESK